MSEQKIQAILKKLSIQADGFSDFVMSLADIHQQVGNALQLAPLVAGTGEMDDEGSVEAFMSELLTSFDSYFNEGGMLAAAKSLEESLGSFGVSIDLSGSQEHLESINLFIREYGLKDFFAAEFNDSFFFVEEQADTGDSEGGLSGDISEPTEEDSEGVSGELPEPLGPEIFVEEEVESHPSDVVAIEIFEATSGEFAGRQDAEDEGGVPQGWASKNLAQKKALTAVENTFINIDTSHRAFERENSGFNYSERLRSARGKSEYITPLNFHPIFRALGSSAIGLSVDETVDPPVVSVSLDKMAALRQAVLSELVQIQKAGDDIQIELEADTRKEGFDRGASISAYSEKRRQVSNRLDDLLSAIKNRDGYVTDLLYRGDYKKRGFSVNSALRGRAYELSSEFRSAESKITKTLIEICNLIVFSDIQKGLFHYGEAMPDKFKDNYEAHLSEPFLKFIGIN